MKEKNGTLNNYDSDSIDWHKYNLAKSNEKRFFYSILSELCSIIPEPLQQNGRPRAMVRDVIFSSCLKLYSNYSGRRIYSDLVHAQGAGFISKAPHYNTIFDFLNCEATYDLLKKILEITALPLKQLEDKFSLDSSGFGSYQYERWMQAKFKNKRGWRNYLKGHILIGTRTNVIVSAEVTYATVHDSKPAPKLLEALKDYNVNEVSADMAYASYRIYQIIQSLDAMPYIPFQDRNVANEGKAPEIWTRMYKYFQLNKSEFLKHYHKRSNVETVFSMIKTKLGEFLKCKTYVSQRNELMVKFICHNICCLVSEIFERGIHIDFKKHVHKLSEEGKNEDYSALMVERDSDSEENC